MSPGSKAHKRSLTTGKQLILMNRYLAQDEVDRPEPPLTSPAR